MTAHIRALTERQLEVLHWIVSYGRREGRMPAVREIGAAFGIRSTNGVIDHLRACERKGYLQMAKTLGRTQTSRSYKLTPAAFALWPTETDIAKRRLLNLVGLVEHAFACDERVYADGQLENVYQAVLDWRNAMATDVQAGVATP